MNSQLQEERSPGRQEDRRGLAVFEYREDAGTDQGNGSSPTPARSRAPLSEEELQARFADVFPVPPLGPEGHDGVRNKQQSSDHKIGPSATSVSHGPGFDPYLTAEIWKDLASSESIVRSSELESAGLVEAQCKRAEEHGRKDGFGLGVASARREMAEQLAEQNVQGQRYALTLAEAFDEERRSYFEKAEVETVKLALAVAARILRREAAADPLLLTNAVRVALGQLAASTRVELHVPERDRTMWEETMLLIAGLKTRPEIVGQTQLSTGQCQLLTDLGTVDLGVAAQWEVIEKDFNLEETLDKSLPAEMD